MADEPHNPKGDEVAAAQPTVATGQPAAAAAVAPPRLSAPPSAGAAAASQQPADAAEAPSAEEEEEESDEEGWLFGSPLHVEAGAAQVQWVLDDMMHQLLVVEWFASWVGPCTEAAAVIDRWAPRYPDVAFLRLDVTGGAANTAAAMEKVMTTPEIRRRGARPVLRNGARFPCFTVHVPPNLQPIEQFTGDSALEQLAAVVKQYSAGPVDSAELAEFRASAAAAAAEQSAAAASSEPGAASDALPQTAADSAPSGQADAQPPPLPVRQLKGGAADLKALLAEARSAGVPAAVLWRNVAAARASAAAPPASGGSATAAAVASADGSSSGSAATASTAPEAPDGSASAVATAGSAATVAGDVPAAATDAGALLLAACQQLDEGAASQQQPLAAEIDVAASTANRVLAAALKVRPATDVHIYRDMKLVHSCSSSATDLATALERLRVAAPGSSPTADSKEASSSAAAAGGTAASGAAGGASEAAAIGGRTPTIWDPPQDKFSRKGAVRQFPQGLCHLYPKMPCLRCGCPWWLGEDWDACCVRCGWDCETEGYDDKSRPIPRFKAKWEAFCAKIKAGQTPAWKGTAKP